MKFITFTYYTMVLLLLVGCKKEETLSPSDAAPNLFAVAEGATDAESVIRKHFFDQENIYLLLTDTLKKSYLGKDAYGDDSWSVERVNIGYSINNSGDQERAIVLPEIEKKMQAVEFVKTRLLGHLGQSLRPYSLLLVSSYETYDRYRNRWNKFNVKIGIRCIALSVGDILSQDQSKQRTFLDDVLFEIMKSALAKQPELVLSDFYAYSNNYYSLDKGDDLGWPYVLNDNKVRELGFLKDNLRYYLPGKDADLEAYLKQVISVDPKVFYTQYAAYPLVLAKYNKLSEIITTLGYKL